LTRTEKVLINKGRERRPSALGDKEGAGCKPAQGRKGGKKVLSRKRKKLPRGGEFSEWAVWDEASTIKFHFENNYERGRGKNESCDLIKVRHGQTGKK